MAQILVRNIDEAVKTALQRRAARRGVSMEAEARDILQRALLPAKSQSAGWATRINARFAHLDIPEIQNVPGQAIPAEFPE